MNWQTDNSFNEAILDAIQDIVFLFDIETNSICYVNKQFELLLGYPSEQLLNNAHSTYTAYIHEADVKSYSGYSAQINNVKKDILDTRELRIKDINGHYQWYKVLTKTFSKNPDGTNKLLLGIATNIDKEKQIEAEKNSLIEKYSNTFRIQTLSLFLLSFENDAFVEVSRGFCLLSGYDENELLGKPIYEHRICHDKENWHLIKKKINEDGFVKGMELSFINKAGIKTPCLLSGEIIVWHNKRYILGSSSDISQLKAYEEQISQYRELSIANEQRLSLSIKAAKQGFFDLDMISGDAVTNDEYAYMLGYEPYDFKENNAFWEERLHPDEKERILNKYKLCESGQSKIFDEIFRQQTNTGAYIWVHCLGQVVAAQANGNGLRMVGIHQNITEQKLTEKKLQESLREAEKSAANIRAIIENTTSSIWAINKKYEIIFINTSFKKEFFQNFGIELEIGMNLPEQLPAHIMPIWIDRYNRALAGEHFSFEDAIPVDNGTTVYVEVFMHPIIAQKEILGASFFAQNITPRKMQELEILKAKNSAQENEQKFKAFSVQSSEGITVTNLDGQYIFVNQAFCKMTGYTEAELLGMTVFELGAPGSPKTTFTTSIEEKAGQPIQVEMKRKDRSVFLGEVIGKRIIIGEQILALGTVRDISKQVSEEKFKNTLIKLYEVADDIEIEDLHKLAANALLEISSSKYLIVYSYHKSNSLLTSEYLISSAELLPELKQEYMQIPISKAGKWAEAIHKGKAYINNTYIETEEEGNQLLSNSNIEKMLAVPIFENGYQDSIILLINKSSDYSVEDIRYIKTYLQNIWNIIRRKKAEEQNRILQNAIENSSASVIITDINGNIEYANPAFTEISGYEAKEYLGQNIRLINSDYHQKEFYNQLWKTLKSGKTWTGELRNKHKSGEYFWEQAIISPVFNQHQQIKHFVAIKTNISHLKQLSNELIEAKEKAEINEYKVRSMFENSLSGFLYFTPKGEILEANAAVLKIIGSPSFEATKQINLLSFKPLQEVGFTNHILKCLDTKEIITADAQYTSKWGKTVFMKYFLVPIIVDNEITGIWANLQDLTDLWNTQQELIKAFEKAQESDRLKSAFLRNVSHEVRTPMNAILGISNMLLKPGLSQGQLTQYRNIIHQSTLRLLEVIENMITIAHLETNQIRIEKGEIDANRLIKELSDEYIDLRAKFDKQEIVLEPNIPRNQEVIFYGDLMRIRQILKNLLDNALKFTFAGHIHFGYSVQSSRVIFFVEDTGMGIPQEKLETIFKSFTQADELIMQNHGGTGVGLAIVKGLINLMHGELYIDTELEKGTKIWFEIPVEFKTKTGLDKSKSLDSHKPKLLVVEDEDYNYFYIRELLSELPLELKHARNGQIALDTLADFMPDIILMDIKMPIMDGFQATSIIRKNHPEVPIIAQTAYSFKREECLAAGFTDYITKPINEDQLIGLIKRYTDF